VLSLVVVPPARVAGRRDGFFAAYFTVSLPGRRIVLPSVRHGFSVDSLALASYVFVSLDVPCMRILCRFLRRFLRVVPT
jgi:hypothetical protein